MTRYENTLEGGTSGTSVTAGNSGGASGTPFSSTAGTGGITYDTGAAIHGSLGAKSAATSLAGYLTGAFGSPTDAAAIRIYFKVDTLVGSDSHLLRIMAGATRVASWHINTTGRLRLSDAAGTTGVFTSTDPILPGTEYYLDLYAKTGTTSTNGTIHGAFGVKGAEATPVGTFSSTTANMGTGDSLTGFQLGKISASTQVVSFDSVAWDDDASGLIGAYTASATPLPTPVVSTTVTDASTYGGTNGSVLVSWTAVTGAGHYEVAVANVHGATTGFTTLNANVTGTSYTIAGRSAGPGRVRVIAVP